MSDSWLLIIGVPSHCATSQAELTSVDLNSDVDLPFLETLMTLSDDTARKDKGRQQRREARSQ
jgi:hypothetical protein